LPGYVLTESAECNRAASRSAGIGEFLPHVVEFEAGLRSVGGHTEEELEKTT
jgi:hypothetical protein